MRARIVCLSADFDAPLTRRALGRRGRWLRGSLVLIASALGASIASAQLMKIPPSPPCRVPAGTVAALAPYDAMRRPATGVSSVALLPFLVDAQDAAHTHWPWAIPEGVAAALRRGGGVYAFTTGSVARALVDADNRPDSAARLLQAQYFVVGRITALRERLSVLVELRRTGDTTVLWRRDVGSSATLERVEQAIVAGVYRGLFSKDLTEISFGVPAGAVEAVAMGDLSSRSGTLAGLDSAVAAYERALTLAPGSAVISSHLARAYMRIVEHGGRVASMTFPAVVQRVRSLTAQALAADSTFSEAWTTRAILARVTDPARFDGAATAHARAIAVNPKDADAEHEYGVTLLRLGDDAGAETHFRRALVLEPSRASTLAGLAELAGRRGRWKDVCVLSTASIGAWQYDAGAFASRAYSRLRTGQARDGFADAEIAAMLEPGAWVQALRVLMDVEVSGVEQARAGARTLVRRWLAPGATLSVRDAKYMALALTAVGDHRYAVEAIRRARPIGVELSTSLRDSALAAIRADTAVSRIVRESGGRR